MADISYASAFGGGLSSIWTPCAGVIVPAFVAHVAGLEALAGVRPKARASAPVLLGTFAFVAGFALVFVLLGSSLGAGADWVRDHKGAISKAGGVVIIAFGLAVTGLLGVPIASRRLHPWAVAGATQLGSFIVGAGFAIGWSPCVNQELGTILSASLDPATAGEGASLLSVYSGGFMLPFFLGGVLGAVAVPHVTRDGRVRAGIGVVAGLTLVALGVLVFTERFAELTGYLFYLGN